MAKEDIKKNTPNKDNKDKVINEQIIDNLGQKEISNFRKNFLLEKKTLLKEQLKLETDANVKKELKKEYKSKVVNGEAKNTDGNIIDITNLNKFYCNKSKCEQILHNVDLQIPKGNVVVILGASGSGKTTLLNIMSGLTEATLGDVIINNKNLFFLSEEKRTKFRADNLSFVFQSYNLIPTLTVLENIKVGENLRNKDVEKIPIQDILETLGLKGVAKKYPYQLSGGQNQRVSIGRALAKNPNILFADEPTGALDEEKGREALQMLLDINKKYGTTLIMVTHNPNFALVADMVIYIKDGLVSKIVKNKVKKQTNQIN